MDLEHRAIERLKMGSETSIAYYGRPLIITYSGGKDSDLCLELAQRAGIAFEVNHSHTTADAPQTVRYVRKKFHELELQGIRCSVDYPHYHGRRESLWSLIPALGAPSLLARWCCSICKEQSGKGRAIVTGVRWSESTKRKAGRGPMETIGRTKHDKIVLYEDADVSQLTLSDAVIINNDNNDRRRWTEHCQMQGKIVFNPIIDWTDSDVWEYVRCQSINLNSLYQMGFDRVGCVGCPQSRKGRELDFRCFPAYKNLWRHALERRLEVRKSQGKASTGVWTNIETYWAWWMGENPNQMIMEGYEENAALRAQLTQQTGGHSHDH